MVHRHMFIVLLAFISSRIVVCSYRDQRTVDSHARVTQVLMQRKQAQLEKLKQQNKGNTKEALILQQEIQGLGNAPKMREKEEFDVALKNLCADTKHKRGGQRFTAVVQAMQHLEENPRLENAFLNLHGHENTPQELGKIMVKLVKGGL